MYIEFLCVNNSNVYNTDVYMHAQTLSNVPVMYFTTLIVSILLTFGLHTRVLS